MIRTVTLNPSLDRTLELDRLAQGCVQRVTATRLDPGAKGCDCPRNRMPGPADGDCWVVHILSAPVPALLTRITEGES
jgi:hypothetical protein